MSQSDSDTSLEIAHDVAVGDGSASEESMENKVYIHQVISETNGEYIAVADGEPYLSIVEQPQARGFRFRYPCEGASHGGIQGEKSERGKKSFPAVKVHNYVGDVQIIVRLVTNEKEPRPHAHELIGKNCKDGKCSVQLRNSSTMTASFPNLGIQHVTKKKVVQVLTNRIVENMKIQKWVQLGTHGSVEDTHLTLEEEHTAAKQADEQAKSMQLNVVRLCFEAYLVDNKGAITRRLIPVVSNPIYDSKAPGAGALKICRLDKMAGCCTGGEEVFLLCDKVQKDDIAVRFYEEDIDGQIKWEGYGCFGPADVHRQYAIVFKTPPYRDTNIERTVHVQVQLKRLSDGEHSDPKPFTYFPQSIDKEEVAKKRKKKIFPFGDMGGFSGSGGNLGGARGDGGSKSGGSSGGGKVFTTTAFSPHNRGDQNEDQPKEVEELENFDSGVVSSAYESDLAPLLRASLNTADGITVDTDSQPTGETENEDVSVEQVQEKLGQMNVSGTDDEWQSAESSLQKVGGDKEDENSQKVGGDKEDEDSSSEEDIYPWCPQHGQDCDHEPQAAAGKRIMMPYAAAVGMSLALTQGLLDFAATGDIASLLILLRTLMPSQDYNGDNVLHLAVIHCQPLVVQVLLKVISTLPHHVQHIINQTNTLRQTPLHIAVLTGQSEIVEVLLKHGASPAIRDHQGNTAFHAAAMYDRVACLRAMMPPQRCREDLPPPLLGIDVLNFEGYSPLHLAARRSHVECMKLLLRGGADVDIPDGTSGRTPLHHAVQLANLPVIGCLLLEGQADPNMCSFDGNTALHTAVADRHLSSVALLMAAGADPHIANSDFVVDPDEGVGSVRGFAPKDMAEIMGDEQIIQLLEQESLADVTGTRSPHCESTPSLSDKVPSPPRITGNLERLDIAARMKLSKLLDGSRSDNDWTALAGHLGLGSFVNPLRGMKSPTRALLDNFEALDGTIEQLKEALEKMGRTDALQVIDGTISIRESGPHKHDITEKVQCNAFTVTTEGTVYPSVDEGIDTLSVSAQRPPSIPGVNG